MTKMRDVAFMPGLILETSFPSPRRGRAMEEAMLYTIAVILIILWLVGLVSSYTLGGFIHILLVIAVIVVLLRIIQNRRI
jgi:uncharacterized membrane protein